jgi:hypothetical protein
MKSFKVFFKLFWYLSVIAMLLFYVFFEGYRVFDFVFGNYSVQKMNVSNYSYNTTVKRESITIVGYISEGRVYFSRFDDDINKLYNLYPPIFFDEKKIHEIEVLKFKHSPIVMLIDDNEFSKWKRNLLLSFLYIVSSIIVILILKKNRK